MIPSLVEEGWPEAVERVAGVLRAAGVEARIEEFKVPTPTAADAAKAAGCEPAQIVKSLVFLCGEQAVLAMVPGDRRAEPGRVAAAVGRPLAELAGADDVLRVTGFEPGGVSPFPLPGIERVLIDRSLLVQELVWIGAGSRRHLAALAPTDLARVSEAQAADLSSGG